MGFSRQEYWSGLPFPSPGALPDPGIEPRSPALQADFLLSEPPGKPLMQHRGSEHRGSALAVPRPLQGPAAPLGPWGRTLGNIQLSPGSTLARAQLGARPASPGSQCPPCPASSDASCPQPRQAGPPGPARTTPSLLPPASSHASLPGFPRTLSGVPHTNNTPTLAHRECETMYLPHRGGSGELPGCHLDK